MEAATVDHQAMLNGDEPPIRRLLDSLACPVLTTYQAVGLVPTEGPLHAGLYTNGALERPVLDQADLILAIGLDTVEPIPTPWRQNAPVITLSTAEPIDTFVPADVELLGDLATLGHQLLSAAGNRGWAHTWPLDAARSMRAAGRRRIRPSTASAGAAGPSSPDAPLGPVGLVDAVRQAVDATQMEPVVTVDAGAHFLAVMPVWPVERPFDLLISNGLATMGFALPAAIGAALARPDRPVLAFCGDGGLSMVMAELETIGRLGLPITVVVFNDSALSLIAVKQSDAHGGPSAIRYAATDFATIAEASGMQGQVERTVDGVVEALSGSPGDWLKPRLIDARIDPAEYKHLIAATRG
jgi:acetolactate synthase-1/2/3 large subunit